MAFVLKQTMQTIKQQNMKKIILLFLLACTLSMASNAQCDKKVLYTSAKQEWLNSKNEVQKNDADKVTVEISKTSVILNHNDDPNDVMKGDIKNMNCNWNEAYKNGRSIIQKQLTEGANDVHDATITIEGKDGILFILIEMKDHPDMIIKAYIDKYTEEG
jgi:hypothetical protein